MQGAIQVISVFVVAALTSGCAMGPRVEFDARQDLSPYQTWAWLPLESPQVEANDGNAAALESKLARLIEERLIAKGFRRVRLAPDFYISYQLALREYPITVNEPRAIYQLSSLHAESYLIESSTRVTRIYTDFSVVVTAVRSGQGLLWQATFNENEQRMHAVKLDGAVSRLFEHFPNRDLEIPPDGWKQSPSPDVADDLLLHAANPPP